jgi:uncharacterized protein YhdP
MRVVKTTTQKKFWRFLKKSPISKKLTTSLNKFSATGKVQANVFLHLPIGDKNKKNKNKKNQVKVNAKLIKNQFYALDKKIAIKNIDAKLTFNNKLSIVGTGDIFDKKTNIDVEYKDNLNINLLNDTGNYIISKNQNIWNADLINNDFFGKISFDNSKKIPKIIIDNLAINTSKNTQKNDEITLNPKDIKDFDLIIKDLKINNKIIPNSFWTFKQNDNILNFSGIKSDESKVEFQGSWKKDLIKIHSNLQGDKLNQLFDVLIYQIELLVENLILALIYFVIAALGILVLIN